MRSKESDERKRGTGERGAGTSPLLLPRFYFFALLFTSHRSPLPERLEQAMNYQLLRCKHWLFRFQSPARIGYCLLDYCLLRNTWFTRMETFFAKLTIVETGHKQKNSEPWNDSTVGILQTPDLKVNFTLNFLHWSRRRLKKLTKLFLTKFWFRLDKLHLRLFRSGNRKKKHKTNNDHWVLSSLNSVT